MPMFLLETNVPKDKIPETYGAELGSLIAKMMGRAETESRVTIQPDSWIYDGKGDGPIAQATLLTIGGFGETENVEYARLLSEKLEEIGVPRNRFLIIFRDELPVNVGLNGSTIKKLEFD